MAELVVACVRAGTSYTIEHVSALRDMVSHHLALPHIVVCLTDQPERCDDVDFIDIGETGLTGQWAKMLLFEPSWRVGHKVLFFDLDTQVIGDITQLADVPGEFAIHEGVMVIGAGMASFIWTGFDRKREELMDGTFKAALRWLYPNAPSLLWLLPKGFFFSSKVVSGAAGGGLHRVVNSHP